MAAIRLRAQAALPPHHFWRAKPVTRRPRTTAEPPAPPLPPDSGDAPTAAAMVALEALESARCSRRAASGGGRPSAVCGGGGWEGWSSEEEDDDEALRIEARRDGAHGRRMHAVVAAADKVFADAAPEFCEMRHVRRRFAEWRSTHWSSYSDSYIELCLPTLLAPLVRLQLLRWDPLTHGSIEGLAWYTDLMAASSDADDDEAADAARRAQSLVALST